MAKNGYEHEVAPTKSAFKNLGNKTEEFLSHEQKSYAGPVTKNGQDTDPGGDWEKKDKSAIDMVEGDMFNHKFVEQVPPAGTEMAKTSAQKGKKQGGNGDHFKQGEVAPEGQDCGKGNYRNNVG